MIRQESHGSYDCHILLTGVLLHSPCFQVEMAHIQFTDTLVREYLVSRGFATALKSFDADVKANRDHSFRVSENVFNVLLISENYCACYVVLSDHFVV